MFSAAMLSLSLMLAPAVTVPSFVSGEVQTAFCSGCGCKGGPGWRIHRTGKCASHKNIRKECGNPPSPRRCTREN